MGSNGGDVARALTDTFLRMDELLVRAVVVVPACVGGRGPQRMAPGCWPRCLGPAVQPRSCATNCPHPPARPQVKDEYREELKALKGSDSDEEKE